MKVSETLKREIVFSPAFDRRSPDPLKNYGVHGVNLTFLLKGECGAIQFVVYTNWHLPHVQKEFDGKLPDTKFPYLFHQPMATDLGYHSPKPLYENQPSMPGKCNVLNGTCYYDGSSLNAERVFDILREKGDAGVWEELEEEYCYRFIKEAN